jgi:hypothetical protein
MSNLRSDCRDLVSNLPVGHVMRSHMERLAHQLDHVEELWHAAERKATKAVDRVNALEAAITTMRAHADDVLSESVEMSNVPADAVPAEAAGDLPDPGLEAAWKQYQGSCRAGTTNP